MDLLTGRSRARRYPIRESLKRVQRHIPFLQALGIVTVSNVQSNSSSVTLSLVDGTSIVHPCQLRNEKHLTYRRV